MSLLEQPSDSASAADPLLGWIPQSRRWAPSLRYLLRRDRILRALPANTKQDLLEVGCGAGTLLIELSRRGFNCTGLETSAPALAIGREFMEESGDPVPLEPTAQRAWLSRFDIVCAFDVLEHIEDDVEALRSWTSWLKPGGTLLLTVPAHAARWTAGDEWAGHYRRYDRAQLVGLVEGQCMRVEQFECYGFPMANLTELLGVPYYHRELARRKSADHGSREDGNQRSGIDRKAYQRAFPILNSQPGRAMLRCALKLQQMTIQKDWGSGYLLMARKP